MEELLIDFVPLNGPHSGENMADAFVKATQELGILTKVSTYLSYESMSLVNIQDSQVLAITTDNATSNDAFIEMLADVCLQQGIDFEGKSQHVRCCAHVLNLSVQAGLAELKSTAPEGEDSLLLEEIETSDVIPKVGL